MNTNIDYVYQRKTRHTLYNLEMGCAEPFLSKNDSCESNYVKQ